MSIRKDEKVDNDKRKLLKLFGLSAGALALGSLSAERFFVPESRNQPVLTSYPRAILVDPEDNPILASQIPYANESTSSYPIMVFNYPLQDEPNILVRLRGITIPGGVGPNGDITAYSGICQHLGCIAPLLRYNPANNIPFEAKLIGYTPENWPPYGLIYCKCHGSQYDPTKGHENLYNSGPAPSPANHSLPQVTLEYDAATDYIYAIGMNPLNAVIRTHLWQPNGETYGSEVQEENLSGGTALTLYQGSTSLYKATVVSSSNGPWPGNY
ncbi:MAG: Rieske (2Fe-2S) protein [Thermoplasmataceae archaeon]